MHYRIWFSAIFLSAFAILLTLMPLLSPHFDRHFMINPVTVTNGSIEAEKMILTNPKRLEWNIRRYNEHSSTHYIVSLAGTRTQLSFFPEENRAFAIFSAHYEPSLDSPVLCYIFNYGSDIKHSERRLIAHDKLTQSLFYIRNKE